MTVAAGWPVAGDACTSVIGARSGWCAVTPLPEAGAVTTLGFAISEAGIVRASWARDADVAANNAESTQKSCFVEVSI
jgi:hypothetical protein